ncbi:hypothetical protein ACFQJ5_07635 [Halomicroarcula sp. GCM10025324]|jgi:predicted branched-subunit amino acid permease|uniref:DUF7471 family protein n=1 Tax=Haloarcula TaxID=2237 RepID=UPI0023E8AD04|nr:hypothetical protein [Halomicroarcula sp. ZS-22-S1]
MDWPLHLGVHVGGLHADFAVVLALSAVATVTLCALGVAAYRRRQSRAYLLVVLALAALVARPLVGVLSAAAVVSPETHHLLEHAIDAVVVVLVLGAVYYARSVERRLEGDA